MAKLTAVIYIKFLFNNALNLLCPSSLKKLNLSFGSDVLCIIINSL